MAYYRIRNIEAIIIRGQTKIETHIQNDITRSLQGYQAGIKHDLNVIQSLQKHF